MKFSLIGLGLFFLVSTCCGASVGNTTQCAGRCFQPYDSTKPCQCDKHCKAFDACCDDFVESCLTKVSDTCKNRCGAVIGANVTCECHSGCVIEGNCCSDFNQTCKTSCSDRCDEKVLLDEAVCPCRCGLISGDGNNTESFIAPELCCEDYLTICPNVTVPLISDIVESCVGKCGVNTDGASCQCDEMCFSQNNCCPDYYDVCPREASNSTSCQNRCNLPYNSNDACHCFGVCIIDGNCCEDFFAECTQPNSCWNRCYDPYISNSTKCQCNPPCLENDECCVDVLPFCGEK